MNTNLYKKKYSIFLIEKQKVLQKCLWIEILTQLCNIPLTSR